MGTYGSHAAARSHPSHRRASWLQRCHAANLDPVPQAPGGNGRTGGAGMSRQQEVTYTVDFEVRRRDGRENEAALRRSELPDGAIPRIARLLALAIRVRGLIREQAIQDYAEVARRGRVTRARMTQIMKL